MPVAVTTPVTPADPSPLWHPRPHRRSNYRHVYVDGVNRWGEPVWVAALRRGGVKYRVGTAPTERAAAALAAGWLRAEYGDDWPARRREDVARAKRRAAGAG